jgi:hypothetical protein
MADLSQLSDEQLSVYREMLASKGGQSTPTATAPKEPLSVGGTLRAIPQAGADLAKGAIKGIGRTAYDTMTGFMNPIGEPLKAIAERTGMDKRITGATEPANTVQRIGSYLPDVGMTLAGGEEVANLVPRTSRAIGNFQKAAAVANKVPVDVGHFAQPALRAERINRIAGDPMAPVVQRALEHLGPTVGEPLTYEDARIMASSAGRKAQQQAMGNTLTGEMGRRLKEVGSGLDKATSEAAHSVGVGAEHDAAMREYRQAQALKSAGKTAVKIGVPAAIGTGLAYKGLKGFGYLGD